MATYSKTDVLRLWNLAKEYRLDGLDKLERLGLVAVTLAYNGTGAEWMAESVRKLLDRLSWVFLPAVLIHDVDYAFGEGTMLDFQRANNRLEYNMLTIADAAYAWYNPMRYIRRRQARVYARACRLFGIIAYNSAYQARQKVNQENQEGK